MRTCNRTRLEGVTIHYANRIEDVLAIALPKSKVEAVRGRGGARGADRCSRLSYNRSIGL